MTQLALKKTNRQAKRILEIFISAYQSARLYTAWTLIAGTTGCEIELSKPPDESVNNPLTKIESTLDQTRSIAIEFQTDGKSLLQ